MANGTDFTTYTENAFQMWREGRPFEEIVADFAHALTEQFAAYSKAEMDNVVACVRSQAWFEENQRLGVDVVFELIKEESAKMKN